MFKTIPGFEKFEMDSQNKIIRSVKGKNVLEVKKGKVRLTDNKGDRKFYDVSDIYAKTFLSLSKDEITKVSKPDVKKVKVKKEKKSPKVKEKKEHGKVSEKQAEEIRKKYKDGVKVKDIAKEYGIHTSSVYDIKNFVFKKVDIKK